MSRHPLPVCPEGGDNEARRDAALNALESFMAETGADDEDALGDLLCNLRHLCDRDSDRFGDFDRMNARGQDHYKAETDGSGPLGNMQYAPGTHPEVTSDDEPGRRATCARCNLEIERHPPEWLDRGGNSNCAADGNPHAEG